MTAPGSGFSTSGGECTAQTPCFVCELKAIVAAVGVSAKFSDAPFVINILGCRGANTISDKFDDRMVAFMSLPASDAVKALDDQKVEEGLMTAIADAAETLNGAKPVMPGRGVRRVACSSIELEPGIPTSGHRLVVMFPITTDPGLVRLKKQHEKQQSEFEEKLDTRVKQLKKLQDSKKSFDDLSAQFNRKGAAVKNAPKPQKKGDAKSAELLQAEAELKEVQDAIDALAVSLSWSTSPKSSKPLMTTKTFEDRIASATKAHDHARQQLDDYTSGKLVREEVAKFKLYHYAFQRDDGTWEADNHAFFPVGYYPNRYDMGLHHRDGDNATPALTVGEFLGERIITGRGIKRCFKHLEEWPRSQREKAVPSIKHAVAKQKDANAKERQKFDTEMKATLNKLDVDNKSNPNARTDKAAHKKKLDDDRKKLEADLQKKITDITGPSEKQLFEASREYVELAAVRKAAGPTPPPGTWVVMACNVGAAPIVDDDEFEIEGNPGRMSGREVRLHYYSLVGEKGGSGLKIHGHYPAQGHPVLPTDSMITATEAMFEVSGKLMSIRDDDVFEVKAMIGGTNIHRGHKMVADEKGTVTFDAESLDKVSNWSIGCQVVALHPEFNLFILLASLSKRWQCLQDSTAPKCTPIIKEGSSTAPDPYMWAHLTTQLSFPPEDVRDKLTADMMEIQHELKIAQDEVTKKVDAWFKARKMPKRPKDSVEAEKLMADTLDKEVADTAWKKDDATRQKLTSERQDLADAARPRDAARHRANMLAVVQKIASPGKISSMSFKDTETWLNETWLNEVDDKLKVQAAEFADAPEAKEAAAAVSNAVQTTIEGLRKTCYMRSVKMKHDWMRTCDVENACKKRYSYTLIEVPPADSNGKILSLAKLDSDFAKKVGKNDVNPPWSGFKA